MGFTSPSPPHLTTPPPAAHPPTLGSQAALTGTIAGRNAKLAEGMGADDTIKTSPQGLTEKPSTAPVTLLGR